MIERVLNAHSAAQRSDGFADGGSFHAPPNHTGFTRTNSTVFNPKILEASIKEIASRLHLCLIIDLTLLQQDELMFGDSYEENGEAPSLFNVLWWFPMTKALRTMDNRVEVALERRRRLGSQVSKPCQ